jgi:hypothetical protein
MTWIELDDEGSLLAVAMCANAQNLREDPGSTATEGPGSSRSILECFVTTSQSSLSFHAPAFRGRRMIFDGVAAHAGTATEIPDGGMPVRFARQPCFIGGFPRLPWRLPARSLGSSQPTRIAVWRETHGAP